jgi:hypothetical protein
MAKNYWLRTPHPEVASNINRVALYSLRADRTEISASIFETCLPNHCVATVATLTAANSLLRFLLPSNEQ